MAAFPLKCVPSVILNRSEYTHLTSFLYFSKFRQMNYPEDLGKIQSKISSEIKEKMNKISDVTLFTSDGNNGT